MKIKQTCIAIACCLLLVVCLADFLTGCASSNPLASPPGQPANGQPAYVVNPTLTTVSNAVSSAETFTAPFNPYSPITNPLATAVLGIIGTVSAWLVQKKNVAAAQAQTATAQATAGNHLAVIQTMASGIVKAGPTAITAVQDVASTTSSSVLGQVAAHLNDATP